MNDSPWYDLRERLARELGSEPFETWLAPLSGRAEGDRLILSAPTARFRNSLEESFLERIAEAWRQARGAAAAVVVEVEDRRRGVEAPAPPQLNPRYLFDTFVVGSSNQFAHAAARAVAESPARSYNPLFLYGGVGLGKTHLLHAIGHQIASRHTALRIGYQTAEQFVNDLIASIRHNRMPEFRERQRSIDVLLVDDVQFLAGKERTQEEFFHTFNTLYSSQKQIILSSDSPPRNIPALEERLRSRFEWGLIADIQPPDLETKIAILRRKAELGGVHLPDDVALFVANQVRANIRELEGLLNRVLAFSSLTGRPLSLDLTRETLRDILDERGRRSTAPEVIKFVARHYGLKVSEIKSRSNAKQFAFPRQVAMYLCKQLTDLSYPEIGRQFNDKHHSTVIYSVEKISELRKGDPELDRVLETLAKHFA
ncbi:MAG: chromosomal replication initiator protein DnaA [Thermoanaerobaculia bacterium]|nr:chromosomal replication initiator protein DnaA [Thermoanaerobaculia bacterium]MCZ7652439.1 chromosomal replication initiator protein DnaA [Thermoanaerobaculia bacterium]